MPDEKIKFLMWIDPATDRKIKAIMSPASCRSQSEFMEKALQFYCDYVASQGYFSVLPPMLIMALRAAIQDSRDHICRLLFKLAVKVDIVISVLAAVMKVPKEQLRELWRRCVQEVEKAHGIISPDGVVEYQNGGD